MLRVMDRYHADTQHVDAIEIARESVFFPTKNNDEDSKSYINSVTSIMILQYGAVEFTTLEKSNEENSKDD